MYALVFMVIYGSATPVVMPGYYDTVQACQQAARDAVELVRSADKDEPVGLVAKGRINYTCIKRGGF